MKLAYAVSFLLPLALGGCKIRTPIGGCSYDEVEVSPQYVTPWDTVLEEDLAALTGPFPGTLAWLDGDDVIAVPKAGEEIEVEAEVKIDLSTARVHEYIMGDRVAACEPDRLFVDADVSFSRVEDGVVELAVPLTVFRDVELSLYNAEGQTPVSELALGLDPVEEHASQAILTRAWWAYDTGDLHADFTYSGQSTSSASTGQGSFKRVAEFLPAP